VSDYNDISYQWKFRPIAQIEEDGSVVYGDAINLEEKDANGISRYEINNAYIQEVFPTMRQGGQRYWYCEKNELPVDEIVGLQEWRETTFDLENYRYFIKKTSLKILP
jgi:hypothetical protein